MRLVALRRVSSDRGRSVQTPKEIVDALVQLDPATFEEVLTSAYRERGAADEAEAQIRPSADWDAKTFAEWIARRHMGSDFAIERVVYLPAGAPENEIRLLEVNRFLNHGEDDVVESLDFSPDLDDVSFVVLVADVTADQWEQIKKAPEKSLPAGWKLDDSRIYSRG